MQTVTIIGPGRVGGALAASLPPDRYNVVDIFYRGTPPDAMITGRWPKARLSTKLESDSITSDLVFIATQDYEIAHVVQLLAGRLSGSAIFHTSGSRSSDDLAALRGNGCALGSLHPLVSIARPELGPLRFPGSYFCIEGDPRSVAMAEIIVADLGGKSFFVDTRFKTLYHASAVTACGHAVALFDAAVEMMTKCGLSADDSKSILMPLVESTILNLKSQTNAAALTGTFARADTETFTRHLAALNENVSDDLLEIYLLLGERSLELAAKQGINSERIEMLKAKVAVAKSKLKW